MSYNGVGLSTPRGSGTNGHITRNLSNLRPREKFDDRADAKDLYTHRAPDAGILEHERRRRVEVKCLELEVSLQDDGVEEDLVAAQVSALREKLLAQSANANGTERERGSIKSHERHELGQAKALQNERLRLAMGISKDHVEGLAFDREAQAQIRIQKQEEREKAREERTKIEVQLKIDREKALKEREILRKKDDEAIANAKRMHDKRLLDEGLARQQRAQADMRKMDEELDARRAPAGGERDSLDRPAAFDRLPARDEPLPYEGRRPRSPPSRRDDSPPPRSAHSSSRRSPPRDSDRNSRRRDYSPRRGDSPRRRDDSPRGRNESPPARRQRSPTPPFRRRLPSKSPSRSPPSALARPLSPPPRRVGRSPTRSISRSPSVSRSRSRSPAPRRRQRSYSRSVSRSPRSRSYSRSRSPPRRRARRDSPSPRRSPSPGVPSKGGWVRN